MTSLIRHYYDTFNTGDRESLLSLLDDGVVHEINEGKISRVSNHYNLRAWLEMVG